MMIMPDFPFPHPSGGGVVIVGQDATGWLAESPELAGFHYYLTPCCLASAKGGQTGVICRSCHQPVDEALDGWPLLSRPAAIAKLAREIGLELGPAGGVAAHIG